MLELTAKQRNLLGKKVKNLRKEGLLPCVVYGAGVVVGGSDGGAAKISGERADHGDESLPVAVPYKEFEKVFKGAGETSLVKLHIVDDGSQNKSKNNEYNVLINDVAFDPIKGYPIHADFYAVRMDKAIRAKVPVEFIGESPAVKNFSGILVKVMQELEVEALPKDLPRELRADLSSLIKLEERLFVKDIAVPPGVKILAEGDGVIVLVEPPRTDAEVEELKKTEAGEEVAEVKTEKEVKAEEKAKTAEAEEKEE